MTQHSEHEHGEHEHSKQEHGEDEHGNEPIEELAEEASQSSDPSKLRSVLRRSISLNVAPSGVLYPTMPGTVS